MKEVVRKDVVKLLETTIIYLISGNTRVSLVHVVAKKSVMTVIQNEKNELIPTTTFTRW